MRTARSSSVARADVLPAAATAVFVVVGTWQAAGNQSVPRRELDALAWALVAVAVVSVTAWRRRPQVALVVAAAAVGTYLALRCPYGPVLATVAVLAFGVGRERGRSVVASVVAAVVLVLAGLLAGLHELTPWTVAYAVTACVLVTLAPAVVGGLVHGRAAARAGLADELRRRADDEQRLRLAREVHDIVGHNLTVIAMQSGTALALLADRPDLAEPALRTVNAVSKQALLELGAALVWLREPGDGGPLPGLADVPELAGTLRSGGLQVRVIEEGRRRELGRAADRAAYRIVQEALTNVLRHAACPSALVRLRYRDDELDVEVTDTGGPHAAWIPGTGIRGMTERAVSVGGRLTAGPGDGGFVVAATLPYGSRA